MKNILFVSHDASRTGAPIVLLHFLRWLKSKSSINITILLLGNGELVNEFYSVGEVHFCRKNSVGRRLYKKVSSTILGSKFDDVELTPALKKKKFDVLFLNTVDPLKVVGILNKMYPTSKIICHIHENEFSIKNFYSKNLTADKTSYVNRFIAVSKSTKANLVKNYNIESSRIDLIYECVSKNDIRKPSVTVDAIKEELGLSNEFIIGGSGVTSWRKGIDLFIQLAVHFGKLGLTGEVKFVWVGGVSHEFKCQYEYELERLGYKDLIVLTGSKKEPQNYFQIFDVFALTSREDPFPLVALEAAALSKPILCFAESGGIPELIDEEGCGIIVPYGNVEKLADEIIKIKDSRDIRDRLGKAAAASVSKFDVSIIAPAIYEAVSALF